MKPAVLIVDDSLTVRMDLDAAFASAAFATTVCASLATARAALKRSSFSLVILDVMLPDGDGVDFLREMRNEILTAQIPVLLLSSEADIRNRIRGLTMGADDYIGKPYNVSYVIARARELTRHQPHATLLSPQAAILIIDDSPTFRHALARALEDAGHTVMTGISGEDGLRLATELRPTMIIVDGIMPGIDGATVIARIRQDQALRRTVCVLLTASNDRGGELRALDAGADAYLSKDQDLAVVVARVSSLLHGCEQQTLADPIATLLSPKRILLIDDQVAKGAAMAEELRCEGYEVVAAHSGDEGMELLAVQPVDCVLIDVARGVDSIREMCQRIKRSPALRDIPVLVVLSATDRDSQIAIIEAGADDCMTSSFDPDLIKARLRAQVRRRQFIDENRAIREQLLRRELQATEVRSANALAQTRAELIADLEQRFQELEAFSYSASHDLQAPLRRMGGLSEIMIADYGNVLDEPGKDLLRRIAGAAQQMSKLIESLLRLSKVSRGDFQRSAVDISAIAHEVVDQLRAAQPERFVAVSIQSGLQAHGDARLLRIALTNLIGNAWKYTAKRSDAHIAITAIQEGDDTVFMIRDNGVGFDNAASDRLFKAFQRLHSASEFAGTGIGLATVQRIIQRHAGRLWAHGEIDAGAVFCFTLPHGQESTRAYRRMHDASGTV